MVATIPFNPNPTTAFQGGFNATSTGLVQGTAYPDPADRFGLAGGVLAQTETIPMWGGVGIYEDVPGVAGGSNYSLGGLVGRATALTGSTALTGFSVFDQSYAMINTPQSPVPLAASGMQVMFYRLGSGARIAVACDPALINLRGEIITTQVSWDFVNQLLVPYEGTLTISSGTYNSSTGLVTLTMSAPITFDPGDSIIVSSLTGTGTDLADLNGTYTAGAGTTGSTVTYEAATGLGSITITGGSLTLGSGSDSALPVKVTDVQSSNCQTVTYNSATGFATWNFNGSAAVIQI